MPVVDWKRFKDWSADEYKPQQCGTCDFYCAGHCHKNAPVALPVSGEAMWPKTAQGQWCGAWLLREDLRSAG